MDNNGQFNEAQQEIRDVAEHFKAIFSTESGTEVLNHLMTIASVSNLTGNNFMDAQASVDASDFMMIREGQNMVIRYITRMIKL